MFKQFPADVLPHLFSFFSLREIYYNLQFVSKEWLEIANVPNEYNKVRRRNNVGGGDNSDNGYHQSWSIYLVSSFRSGKQFKEINRMMSDLESDASDEEISRAMWDDQHTQLIFSCIEGKMVHGLHAGNPLVKKDGIGEMIKSMQFLYGVHYDKELVKRIVSDSNSIKSCLYVENEEFAKNFQERVVENGSGLSDLKEKFYFMDLCYLDSSLKNVSDEVFIYKIFERVFSLDLDNDWSNVFPCIRKCKLLKQKLEKCNGETIRKMFQIEMEIALKMLLNILKWGYHLSDLNFLYSFASYCKFTQSQSEEIVKLSDSLINEINRVVLIEEVVLTPIIEDDYISTSILDQFKNNKLIEMVNQNNAHPLEEIEYRNLYTNTSCFLKFLHRKFSIGEMFRTTINKRKKLLDAENRLNGYFVFCIVNQRDMEKRAKFLEKIEQAFIYATELRDFRTAFFFSTLLNNACVYRLRKTREHVDRSSNFKNLFEESQKTISSDGNYRKLYQTVEKYAKEANIPM
ncbi:guanine nucleotide dissociation stimulator CDC25-containing protein [Naegleria gruberi]|uniref:Guanine nucleotide dissociation stimulator CDC25-containing protein n=1 Tax=Naegleria gruberi TaxID=5762 RepID=D2VDT1_NAEGR|nr:guanine nucleotide dissociation stimulator CDC25-containing protein [Naegleria gruberi]EFC44953.1 guanine nucleotide dissociation stimulator CDC25-containing protein [Naegleria gruberi]|eukprot:XP_002677697.1 guanine nucleotide dissociation stimulator CDC25-containing protein [Naegleria gruberi strain NEG-M]